MDLALILVLRFLLCSACVFWSLAFVACVFGSFPLRWVEVTKATRIFRQLHEGGWFRAPLDVGIYPKKIVPAGGFLGKKNRACRQLFSRWGHSMLRHPPPTRTPHHHPTRPQVSPEVVGRCRWGPLGKGVAVHRDRDYRDRVRGARALKDEGFAGDGSQGNGFKGQGVRVQACIPFLPHRSAQNVFSCTKIK